MEQRYVSVVLIKEGVVAYPPYLFIGPEAQITEKAERKFLDLCRTHISNFEEYTSDDIEGILDEGCATFGNGSSVCISWPEEIETV